MSRMLLVPLFCVALLGGCAQPFEGRVASQLSEAGLPRSMADCMAAIWVERLNVLQLRKIQRLSGDLRAEGRNLTVAGFIGRVRALDDPEIVPVVTSSAARCAIGV